MVQLIDDYNDEYGNNDDVTFTELLLYICFTHIIHLIFMTGWYFQDIFYTAVFCKMLYTPPKKRSVVKK